MLMNYRRNEIVRIQYEDLITVDLLRKNQVIASYGPGDNLAVLPYLSRLIPQAETDI